MAYRTSTAGVGISEDMALTNMTALDWYDGLRPEDDDLPIENFDSEFIPFPQIESIGYRVEECYSGDCTDEAMCIDCMVHIGMAA